MADQPSGTSGPSPCPVCGAQGTLGSKQAQLTEKRRVKFGLFWLIVTILTSGLGILVWLVWPRRDVVIGIDRYLECRSCGARV